MTILSRMLMMGARWRIDDWSIRPTRDIRANSETFGQWVWGFSGARVLQQDSDLIRAISEAHENHSVLREEVGVATMMLEESDLITKLQEDYVNFYKPETVNPYIPKRG
ncbi:MAG: hypothetical protein Ct9H90mP14_3870 [Methanobacteriota archaeon]|nr:MAG: hypothetical protein Ct9H90mP14_3870 [Euryarchaeota archaeon]